MKIQEVKDFCRLDSDDTSLDGTLKISMAAAQENIERIGVEYDDISALQKRYVMYYCARDISGDDRYDKVLESLLTDIEISFGGAVV